MTNYEWLKTLTVDEALDELNNFCEKFICYDFSNKNRFSRGAFLFDLLAWLEWERNEEDI